MGAESQPQPQSVAGWGRLNMLRSRDIMLGLASVVQPQLSEVITGMAEPPQLGPWQAPVGTEMIGADGPAWYGAEGPAWYGADGPAWYGEAGLE